MLPSCWRAFTQTLDVPYFYRFRVNPTKQWPAPRKNREHRCYDICCARLKRVLRDRSFSRKKYRLTRFFLSQSTSLYHLLALPFRYSTLFFFPSLNACRSHARGSLTSTSISGCFCDSHSPRWNFLKEARSRFFNFCTVKENSRRNYS